MLRFNAVNNSSSKACRFKVEYPDLANLNPAQNPVIWASTGESMSIECDIGKACGYDLQVDNFRASLFRSELKKCGNDYDRIPSTPAEEWHAGIASFSIQKDEILIQKFKFTQEIPNNTKCTIIDMTYVDQQATLDY